MILRDKTESTNRLLSAPFHAVQVVLFYSSLYTVYQLLKKLRIDDDLIFTGYIPEEDLPALYQGAEVFVYPSYYEGFGLPVLEAMSSEVPVITSNTSSLPEVAGNAALLVNPTEIFDLYEAMETLVTSPSLRQDLREKGLKQSQKFTWEKTARQTLEIYEKVLDNERKNRPKTAHQNAES